MMLCVIVCVWCVTGELCTAAVQPVEEQSSGAPNHEQLYSDQCGEMMLIRVCDRLTEKYTHCCSLKHDVVT